MSESCNVPGGELHIDPDAPIVTTQMAPGHWEKYRVNENTMDWRFVADLSRLSRSARARRQRSSISAIRQEE